MPKALTPEQARRLAELKAEKAARDEQVREWLNSFDKDKSGNLSREELRSLLNSRTTMLGISTDASATVLDWIMGVEATAIGPDRQDAVPMERAIYALAKHDSYLKLDPGEADKLTAVLHRHDVDRNGGLDEEELVGMLQEVAPERFDYRKTDAADAKFVLEQCDADANGIISLNELSASIATWVDIIPKVKPKQKSSSACTLL